MSDRCPQCGAELRDHTTCAEQLYRMMLSGGITQSRIREALAQFALSHPMTYSTEALQVASELVAPPKRGAALAEEDDEAPSDAASSICRWWRHFARRMSCH